MDDRHVVYIIEGYDWYEGSDQEYRDVKFSTGTVLNISPTYIPDEWRKNRTSLFTVKIGVEYKTFTDDSILSTEFTIDKALNMKFGENNWSIADSCSDRFNTLCEMEWSWPFEEK